MAADATLTFKGRRDQQIFAGESQCEHIIDDFRFLRAATELKAASGQSDIAFYGHVVFCGRLRFL